MVHFCSALRRSGVLCSAVGHTRRTPKLWQSHSTRCIGPGNMDAASSGDNGGKNRRRSEEHKELVSSRMYVDKMEAMESIGPGTRQMAAVSTFIERCLENKMSKNGN
jgi:hypothetical protein